MFSSLENKVIVVTGAGRGIGKQMSKDFAKNGAKVAMVDLDYEGAAKAAEEISGAKAYKLDISVAQDVKSVFSQIKNDMGTVDVLVNNATYLPKTEDLLGTSIEEFDRTMTVVLNGAFLCTTAVMPDMIAKKKGNIINIATVNAKGMYGSDVYSIAKAGVLAFARTITTRYGKDGIRSNTVIPGTIATEIWSERAKRNPQVFEDLKAWYPMGRVGTPQDVSNVVLFLASDESSWMSGTEVVIDGGLLAGPAPMFRVIEAQG
jgi:meso-butanediol dehydrogenase / (S,S)-butanediol dehydrogenase / diacetyl reductase